MAEEKKTIDDLDSLKKMHVADKPSLTITFRGKAYEELAKLKEKLLDADEPGDVIDIALALLLETEGKNVKLEKDDGETLIAKIWK